MKLSPLSFYKKYVPAGRLPKSGLCSCKSLFKHKGFHLIEPWWEERVDLYDEGFHTGYWASCISQDEDYEFAFTPVRQNIVLLLAAMQGEL
jgi:hypothetical protein